ncbi:hypothetical protein MKW98_002360 [Papaver atlanticum]|uniref:ELMO domain-containing protein n=1 Tax=Papaver atlanticum TaxID=357466 RepID=A0AAD4SCP0_9MAGN|nr:hypothetical protein MKW98_002360 [Papaver atlanticum]
MEGHALARKRPIYRLQGGGFISLQNLLFFERSEKKSFQDLLQKQEDNGVYLSQRIAVLRLNSPSRTKKRTD